MAQKQPAMMELRLSDLSKRGGAEAIESFNRGGTVVDTAKRIAG